MFQDRADAGRRLARELDADRDSDPARPRAAARRRTRRVRGRPRAERALSTSSSSASSGSPSQPELRLGAVGEDGVLVRGTASVLAADPAGPDRGPPARERRARRAGIPHLDGCAATGRGCPWSTASRWSSTTGWPPGPTARAACQVARAHGARAVVLAVPVASRRTAADLREDLEDLVCLDTPHPFWAVGQVYRDFGQVSDAEVLDLLGRATWTPDAPAQPADPGPGTPRDVLIPVAGASTPLAGILDVPPRPVGLVAFAHGSGSSRFSPRNRRVARVLGDAGLGTLLLDLLTEDEEGDRSLVFDIEFLAERLAATAAGCACSPVAGTCRSACSARARAPPPHSPPRPTRCSTWPRWSPGAGVPTWRPSTWPRSAARRCSSWAGATRRSCS